MTELVVPERKDPPPIRMRLELYKSTLTWALPVPGTEKTSEFRVAGAFPVFDRLTRMPVTPELPGR